LIGRRVKDVFDGRAGPEFASMTMMTMMIFVPKLHGAPGRLD